MAPVSCAGGSGGSCLVSELLGPLELHTGGLDGGERLRVGDASAVRVAELTGGGPGGADRGRSHIRRADPDLCKIDVLARTWCGRAGRPARCT
jgi:hypothetical protein